MPEEAVTAEPLAPTEPTAPPAEPSTEPSTSAPTEPSLGQQLLDKLNAPAPTQPAPAPPEGAPDPDHWQKVKRDHSQEIGDARKRIEALETQLQKSPAEPAGALDTLTEEQLFAKPADFIAGVKTLVKEAREGGKQDALEEFNSRYGQTLEEARGQSITSTIAAENPIAKQLLNDSGTQVWLNDLKSNPEALKRYADPTKNAFYAALFHRMTGVMSAQATARSDAPTPPRPETAGLATPSGTPPPPPAPPDMAAEVAKMTTAEAGEAFATKVQDLMAKSGLK